MRETARGGSPATFIVAGFASARCIIFGYASRAGQGAVGKGRGRHVWRRCSSRPTGLHRFRREQWGVALCCSRQGPGYGCPCPQLLAGEKVEGKDLGEWAKFLHSNFINGQFVSIVSRKPRWNAVKKKMQRARELGFLGHTERWDRRRAYQENCAQTGEGPNPCLLPPRLRCACAC